MLLPSEVLEDILDTPDTPDPPPRIDDLAIMEKHLILEVVWGGKRVSGFRIRSQSSRECVSYK